MRFVTIDFETFYSKEYSLSRISTEDYVNDPRFEVILVGIKINNDVPYWITGTHAQLKTQLLALNLHECAILAHNMLFDGLILERIFGIIPKMYMDTLCMAQAALKPFLRSISLASCLKHLNLGVQKGTYVQNMLGRTRDSLSKHEMAEYGQYCVDDCEGEFLLFKWLAPQFPKMELEIIDMTLRMYMQPTVELDPTLLAELLQEVKVKKAQVLNALPEGIAKADLMSNPKFAEVLRGYGIDPPTKISPTTGEITYAFAKGDTAWKELEEEWADDDEVSAILSSRISAKSTLEESRLQRLLDISLKYPFFRIPLRYYAAHTGRYGGMESINAQNFPRVDKSRMRFAIKAPKGYVILAADLAQIEARINAWLSKQKNLTEAFRNGEDIYSIFASVAFGTETVKDRSPADKKRRFVGKTCILGLGYGMGDAKLRSTLRKDNVKAEPTECMKYVNTYRNLYSNIPGHWRTLDNYIPIMASGAARVSDGPIMMGKHVATLPNGMSLVYNNLRRVDTPKYTGWAYDFAGEVRTMWGGKLTENFVQALARLLIMEYMLKIKHTIGLYPWLQQHDELDYLVPEQYAEKVKAVIEKIMRVPPDWAKDLPVEVEVAYGQTLGDCK